MDVVKLSNDNFVFDDNEFKLVKMVVLVEFRLFILNTELVDNEFKLVNMVVLVDDKFDIDVVWPFINNIEALEKLFKLLDKPDIDKYDALDNEFRFVNIVVLVADMFDIDDE